MAVYPLDWSSLAAGGNGALCVLIAGYPHPIVAAGVSLTDVSWTSDADTAWHAGTSSITPKPWLDVPNGWNSAAPPVVIEEKSSPVQQEVNIAPIYLRFADPSNATTGNGSVTELLYSTRAQPATYLTSSLQAAATTANVESTSAFASSGDLYIGREVIGYSGKTSTTFTGLTRGKYGTRDKLHAVLSEMVRPQVYSNVSGIVTLPSLKGRRVTLWLLRFASASSTTAVDPALLFDGRVGAGATLEGPAIHLPVLHALKALETKLRPTKVLLSGYHHGGAAGDVWSGRGNTPTSDGQLLCVYVEQRGGGSVGSNFTVSLTASDDDSGSGTAGWCPSAAAFLTRWNNRASALVGGGYTLRAEPSGTKLSLSLANSSITSTHVQLAAAWNNPPLSHYPTEDPADGGDTPIFPLTAADFPGAWVPLTTGGPFYLSQTDAGQIPTPPSATGGSGIDGGAYQWALEAPKGDRRWTILLFAVDASGNPGHVSGTLDGGPPTDPMDATLTAPTVAELVARCTGDSWWGALRYGVFAAVDAWQGLDLVSDSFAWDHIRDVARALGAGLPISRRYTIRGGDALVEVLKNECALNGLVLCTYRGRISVARIRDVSMTDPSAGTVTSADLLRGQVPRMIEAEDGTASSYKVKLPGNSSMRVVDVVAEDEAGSGREIAADATAVLGESVSALALVNSITQQAMAVLGPFSRAYRVVSVAVDLRFAGVQIGDVIYLSEWLLPNDEGGRGLSSRPCVVMGRKVTLAAPEGTRVELDLLQTGPDFAGYAPELYVGSLSGTTISVDTTYLGAQGPYGFADETLPSGAARTDGGASTFTADDAVSLHEMDSTSPASPYTTSIASVSGTTIELAGSPGAAWETLAGTQGKVLLAFDGYASAEVSQRRYCYIATTAGAIGSDAARRFAG